MQGTTKLYEKLSFNTHPSLESKIYDGWLIRFANGFTRRANSVNLLEESKIDIDEKIAYCEKYYKEHGLPCVFKVTDDDLEIAEYLEKRGYKVITPTDLMIMPLEGKEFPETDCVYFDEPVQEWLDAYFAMEGYTKQSTIDNATAVIKKVDQESIYCMICEDRQPVSCATAVLEDGYMILQNVVTDERFRGRGYGRAVCENLLSEAIKRGAHTAYLQVVQGNGPAFHIYETLGYKKIYTYRYLEK